MAPRHSEGRVERNFPNVLGWGVGVGEDQGKEQETLHRNSTIGTLLIPSYPWLSFVLETVLKTKTCVCGCVKEFHVPFRVAMSTGPSPSVFTLFKPLRDAHPISRSSHPVSLGNSCVQRTNVLENIQRKQHSQFQAIKLNKCVAKALSELHPWESWADVILNMLRSRVWKGCWQPSIWKIEGSELNVFSFKLGVCNWGE